MEYEVPSIKDYGSIVNHTFKKPGGGKKGHKKFLLTDKFREFSDPASLSGEKDP